MKIKISGGPPASWHAEIYRGGRVAKLYRAAWYVPWKYRVDDKPVSWLLGWRLWFATLWQGRRARRLHAQQLRITSQVERAQTEERRWQPVEPAPEKLPEARVVER